MYRHALRVSEVICLRWDLIDLKMALFHVRRLEHPHANTNVNKTSLSGVHETVVS
jgi:hypothetical protein